MRQICIDPDAYWLHQTRNQGQKRCFPIVWSVFYFKMAQKGWSGVKVHQYDSHRHYRAFYLPARSREEEKKLASHRSCHHVPSHSFLQAGRHFISWLYSFWFGSSPHSSVITVLKMAHPSRWGLSRAINRRAPQRRICLWAGTELNRFAAVSPSSFLPCLVVQKSVQENYNFNFDVAKELCGV